LTRGIGPWSTLMSLRGFSRRLEDELGEWIHDAWANAAEMHICFYEGWCTGKDVGTAYKRVERLVREVATRIKKLGFI